MESSVTQDAMLGWIIHVGITVVLSAILHFLTPRFFIASATAALAANLIYQVVAYFQAGFLDKFALVGFVVGFHVSFGIALVVGIPFWMVRKKKKNEVAASTGGKSSGTV